jgi:hypothetical protein
MMKYRTVNTHGGVEVQFHGLLTSVLGEKELYVFVYTRLFVVV